MKTSTFKMIAVFTAVSLVASVSVAKNGNGGGGGNKGGNGGGNGNHSISAFKIGGGNGGGGGGNNNKKNSNGNNNSKSDVGKAIATQLLLSGLNNNGNNGNNGNGQCNNNNNNGNNNGNCNNGNNNGQCNNDQLNNQLGDQDNLGQSNLGRSFEPFHSSYVVLPGDTLFEVSLKEYGTSANARFISQFNNLGRAPALVVGQTLQIPAISAIGQLSVSRAPAAESLQSSPVTNNLSTASNFAGTTSTAPAVSAPLLKVNVGSTLLVDGQTFGDKQGVARLRVGGAALKIEVVEWAGSSVKIRLPQLDLASAASADIEVVRADGSLASKTGIELSAPTEVALAK